MGDGVLFVEAPETREQVEKIPQLLPEVWHLISIAPKTPNLSVDEIEGYGYAIAIYPGICLTPIVDAARGAMEHLREHGIARNTEDWRESFASLNAFLGAD